MTDSTRYTRKYRTPSLKSLTVEVNRNKDIYLAWISAPRYRHFPMQIAGNKQEFEDFVNLINDVWEHEKHRLKSAKGFEEPSERFEDLDV